MQLRNAKTSALVFEGTPYAVAKLWSQDPDAYIFDDSYPGFDPHDEIVRYEELEDLLDELKRSRAKGVAEQREAAQNTLDALNPGDPEQTEE